MMKTMEELLASLKLKSIILNRGDQVEGIVVFKNEKEVVLDLGTKSEGIISAKDLGNTFDELKVGSKLSAYVEISESESGQVLLSTQKQSSKVTSFRDRSPLWNKFVTARVKKTLLIGKVIEQNSGGLVVEVDGQPAGRQGVRGFLPTSLSQSELEVGQETQVFVTEIDPLQNRLIFSQRKEITDEEFAVITQKYQPEQVIKGVVKQVSRAGFTVELEASVQGFLPSSKAEGMSFEIGQSIQVMIDNIDKTRRKINLVPFVTSTFGLIYK